MSQVRAAVSRCAAVSGERQARLGQPVALAAMFGDACGDDRVEPC